MDRPIGVVKPLDTRSDFEKAIDKLKHGLTNQLELTDLQAKLAKGQYDALVNEGFTVEQAMQIVINQPTWK